MLIYEAKLPDSDDTTIEERLKPCIQAVNSQVGRTHKTIFAQAGSLLYVCRSFIHKPHGNQGAGSN
jgi:hypothetical protein